jgi:GNAT superfamily N-acetyltransferase
VNTHDDLSYVRPATSDDVPLLLQLIRELADYEKLSDDVVATEEALRRTLFGEKTVATALLAFSGEFPAGFAVYFLAFSTFMAKPVLYVEDIFVLESLRGKGIGRQLFSELIEIAEREKCGRMEWSVLDWNEPAIRFYDRLGAQPRRQWVRYGLPASEFLPASAALKKFANQGRA